MFCKFWKNLEGVVEERERSVSQGADVRTATETHDPRGLCIARRRQIDEEEQSEGVESAENT